MCTAALFMPAKSWKQPRCPSMGEWINKLVLPDRGVISVLSTFETEISSQAMKRHRGTLNANLK